MPKFSLHQVAVPVSNTTFPVTDPLINNDFKGAIIWGGSPTADATNTANFGLTFGAVDSSGNNGNVVHGSQDAVAAASNASGLSGASGTTAIRGLSNAGALNLTGGYNATLSNGVQLALASNDGLAHLLNVLMFAGIDVEFKVTAFTFALNSATVVVTHQLSGVPGAVVAFFSDNNTALDALGHHNFGVGMFDGNNSIGMGTIIPFEVSPTKLGARIGTSDMGHAIIPGPTDNSTRTIGSVGASSLTLTRTSTNSICSGFLVAWRNLTSSAAALAFGNTSPNATGPNVLATGMSVQPQLWLNFSTRASVTTLLGDDTAGSWGMSGAVNNNSNTQYGSTVGTYEYNVTTTVCKTQSSAAQASMTLNNTGAVQFASTVQSWNPDGATESVGTAPVTAFERINLLYGITPVSGPGPMPRQIYLMP